jgi:ADP-ribosylglycohydrolase
MLGTVVGDVYGSCYEKSCISARILPALCGANRFTDDTVITMAVAEHLLDGVPLKAAFKDWVAAYPSVGYGKTFEAWAEGRAEETPVSWANGALMRIGPVAPLSKSIDEALATARVVTQTTHGHPVALGAVDAFVSLHWQAQVHKSKALLLTSWLAAGGKLHSVEEMHQAGSPMRMRADDTLEDVMSCLAESEDFPSLMAACLYHGGDSDTIAAVAGVLGEALWGVPPGLVLNMVPYLDARVIGVLTRLYARIEGARQ